MTKQIMSVAASIGGGTIANASTILQNLEKLTNQEQAKVDKKLYIGNLPPGT